MVCRRPSASGLEATVAAGSVRAIVREFSRAAARARLGGVAVIAPSFLNGEEGVELRRALEALQRGSQYFRDHILLLPAGEMDEALEQELRRQLSFYRPEAFFHVYASGSDEAADAFSQLADERAGAQRTVRAEAVPGDARALLLQILEILGVTDQRVPDLSGKTREFLDQLSGLEGQV